MTYHIQPEGGGQLLRERLGVIFCSVDVTHFARQITASRQLERAGSGNLVPVRFVQHIITVCEDLLPWGCDVADLFIPYGFPHNLPQFGKMLLHCAYVLHEGKAILFTAPSGTGKSTQAALWQKHCGSVIVNGDRAAIGLENGTVTAYGLPISGTSPDCKNVTAPVAAIVKLSQAKENRVTRMNDMDAARCLLSGTYLPQEFSRDLPVLFDLAVSIGECVPVFHLECLPEESAVRTLLPLLME